MVNKFVSKKKAFYKSFEKPVAEGFLKVLLIKFIFEIGLIPAGFRIVGYSRA